ncbi:serine/threonine-protein phosphatase 2A regulatory subunit B'' subunit alpha [Bradysia coprophila]|uniref:serine/threonine-protein phosphatase 2A regulatory subunit B'' subunit alpha n=1 Tax=Bradysia coprophila TaxID=38358 RepID=UPI00187DCEDA|nr:serine/threonine-protein phosphatase 2A regulatory subunit B'' subunit alpha [Bradysia coprophila]XP_037049894.1 serine/threonine-protein phosphatase 2A regulatory subunit B'' subunit alpha [Bradysia coprophila]XP_037049895.1 serine/threonine-protein phosphatase 2A regulatory subunit B'' subunit alpha [Bradysia coprophila]
MATTAKQSSSVRGSSASATQSPNFAESGEEDIETIAKQISDHAEAIYQNWKARGLAPTEILNCHTGTSDAFGKTLTPPTHRSKESPVTELLAQAPDMSNNNLEKLVSSFVNEDKARQQRKSNILTSGTIKDALRKFECADRNTSVKPNYLRNTSPQPNNQRNSSPQPSTNGNKLNKNVPDVLMNTIDQVVTVKEQSPPRQKPETPAKPASLINHTPSWPLKNRLGSSPIKKDGQKNGEENINSVKHSDKTKKSSDLMDEVLMEEERLINALKTGTVLNNDKMLPEVITSTLLTDTTDRGTTWTKPSISTTVSSTSITTTIYDELHHKPVTNQSTEMAPTKITKPFRPRNDAAVPHPEVSLNSTKANHSVATRGSSSNAAVRPFLTRGSVAERVLMFEKCPEAKALRNIPKEPAKLATKPVAKPSESHTTLQRHIRGSKNVYIPKFYYPFGKPAASISLEQQILQRLQAAFDQFPNKQVPKEDFTNILKICALPLYWRMPLFHCAVITPNGLCDGKKFIEFWKQMSVFCHDQTSRFVFILSHGQRSRQYILPEDLVSLVQDVVDTHPGLAFLKEAAEFHSRYVHTVIARIFYTVNRSWSGRITIPELRRSNLLQVLQLLEEEEDINQIMAYFSYEHFYVIYCKFWELDRDHDLFIDQNDLARHNDHALSTRIIERIFSGCVTKGARNRNNSAGAQKMSYTEFVWFLLSEEDKTNPTAVEYWFRCMDLDGDGVLSMYELEYFYEEQQHRMESIGIETLPFEDCLCQMLDMIKPMRPGYVTLSDLKRCKMTPIFYDTFFNLEKYMEHEQRDPFASQRDQDEMTDWDRYAAQEYELLVAEEGGDTQGSYDEDEDEYESNIDVLETQLDDCMSNMIKEW